MDWRPRWPLMQLNILWNKPNIVGLEETDADESLGRPIIASDIVRAVPEAFRRLGSMEG